MSWWISLNKRNGECIDTDIVKFEGGTQVLGGTTQADVNVTYNYGKHFNFDMLNGLSALEAKELLLTGINKLGDDEDLDDFWNPTEGNAKIALQVLLDFAEYAIKKNIDAVFRVN